MTSQILMVIALIELPLQIRE